MASWINIAEIIFPVGSIWQTISAISPASSIGGTWEKIEGRFLLSSNSSYLLNSIGGEINHTLTLNEMPNHTHGYYTWLSRFGTTGANGKVVAYENPDYAPGGATLSTGNSQPHNNMPPYLVVNIWKRVS